MKKAILGLIIVVGLALVVMINNDWLNISGKGKVTLDKDKAQRDLKTGMEVTVDKAKEAGEVIKDKAKEAADAVKEGVDSLKEKLKKGEGNAEAPKKDGEAPKPPEGN